MKKTKLSSIAAKLGISKCSVSRALSGKPGVSDALRRKIRRFAGNPLYAPNHNASALRTGKGDGLVLINELKPTHVAMFRNRAILELWQKRFGNVRLLVKPEEDSLEKQIIQALSFNPGAIIINSVSGCIGDPLLAGFREREIPLVVIDSDVPRAYSITIDRRAGIYQATSLLLLSGCRNPVFISAVPPDEPDSRIQGIVLAYKFFDRKPQPENFFVLGNPGFNIFRMGYEITEEILRTRVCDGIIWYNDEMALGSLRALADAKIKVPEEIRVIGFDNLPYTQYSSPSLTTIAQPIEEPAQAAVEYCAGRRQNSNEPSTVNFETKLVVRESAPVLSQEMREKVFRKINFADKPESGK